MTYTCALGVDGRRIFYKDGKRIAMKNITGKLPACAGSAGAKKAKKPSPKKVKKPSPKKVKKPVSPKKMTKKERREYLAEIPESERIRFSKWDVKKLPTPPKPKSPIKKKTPPPVPKSVDMAYIYTMDTMYVGGVPYEVPFQRVASIPVENLTSEKVAKLYFEYNKPLVVIDADRATVALARDLLEKFIDKRSEMTPEMWNFWYNSGPYALYIFPYLRLLDLPKKKYAKAYKEGMKEIIQEFGSPGLKKAPKSKPKSPKKSPKKAKMEDRPVKKKKHIEEYEEYEEEPISYMGW